MLIGRLAQETARVPATRLSRPALPGRQILRVSRLARLSLGALAIMIAPAGCIVADPPEYGEPVQTRPELDTAGAVPLSAQVIVVDSSNKFGVKFTVPVRSEDAGENLFARFVLDYGATSEDTLFFQRIPASTYTDVSRSANFPGWIPKASLKDCHVITLIVAHESTFTNGNIEKLEPIKAGQDAVFLNWWMNVDPALDATQTLKNCPVPSLSIP
jgi:hypothetical protein